MMKIFKISALCAFALFMAFGCQKTVDVTPVFVEKIFFPIDEADAVSRVKTFLAAVEASKTGERTTFSDMEVNEGRWTLEGTGNYEKNVNLMTGDDISTKNYSLNVSNITVNGILMMSGASMVSEYTNLLSAIAQEEAAAGRVASAMDMTTNSVSSTSTVLDVSVVFEKSTVNNLSWAQAAIAIVPLIGDLMTDPPYNACSDFWIPNVTVYEDQPGQANDLRSGGGATLSSIEGDDPTLHILASLLTMLLPLLRL